VGGEVAGSLGPFQAGLAVGLAIRTCFISHHSVTSFAGIHDGITSSTVVGTAVLLHEDAFCSRLDGLTNHGDLPPFMMYYFLNLLKIKKILKSLAKPKKKSYHFWVTRFGTKPTEINKC